MFLGSIIGIITILGLAAVKVIKKGQQKHKDQQFESQIMAGNYPIYDMKKNDDDQITDFCIGKDDDTEFWLGV